MASQENLLVLHTRHGAARRCNSCTIGEESMWFLAPVVAFLHLSVVVLSGEPPAAAKAKVPALIVFGDSTVDTGNNNYLSTLVRSDFAPYGRDLQLAAAGGGAGGRPTGRFSNGRLAVDFISEAFGLPPLVPAYLDPTVNMSSLAAGACFASAGAGYDNATSDLFDSYFNGVLGCADIHGAARLQSVLPLWKELDYFKEYTARLRSFRGDDAAAETLSEALYIVSMGTNDFLENYYAPAAHGFENVKAGCCGVTGVFEMGYMCGARSPLTCADASKFAFWDAIHPTERLHRAIADAKMNSTLYVFL
uniref:GDSL esterase/lipase n=1 Tax=Oryza brachyantha TaxID=4533 RepID=J3LAD8_ORYBR